MALIGSTDGLVSFWCIGCKPNDENCKKSIGIICIILGFLALITPLTPGSWLILIGLEILGLGFLLDGRLSRFLKGKNKERFENFLK